MYNNITNNYTNYTSIDSIKPDDEIFPDSGYIIGYEISIVLGFKYTASILSLFGSLFIIICYIYLTCIQKYIKKNENKPRVESENNKTNSNNTDYSKLKLGYGHDFIFCLAVSDFFLSISNFIKTSGFESRIIDAACITQGVIMNFMEMSSICWTSVLAYTIYLSTKTQGISRIPKLYKYFFFFSYGLPLIFTIIPLFNNSYGPAGAWCWLNTKNLDNTMAWLWSLFIYIFNWVNIIFNIFAVSKSLIYFKVRTFELKEDKLEEVNFLKNFCIVLKFFPIILIICWLPATVNRLYLFASGDENTFLYTIHAFFSSLTGFLNCLVYSYYYKNLIKMWFCGKRVNGDSAQEGLEISKIKSEDNNNYEKNVTIPSIDEKNKEKNNENI